MRKLSRCRAVAGCIIVTIGPLKTKFYLRLQNCYWEILVYFWILVTMLLATGHSNPKIRIFYENQ